MILVTGSKALVAHDIDIGRAPQDHDCIMPRHIANEFLTINEGAGTLVTLQKMKRFPGIIAHILGSKPVEIEYADVSSTAGRLLEIVEANGLYLDQDGASFASPDVVFTLKMSHRFLKNSPHFLKTRRDILKLRSLGYSIPSCLEEWYKDRVAVTLNYGHPSLARKKSEFFTSNFPYVYEHDDIHFVIARHGQPAYDAMKASKAEVFISKERFMASPEHLKLATVIEEAEVLALERVLIPNNFTTDPLKAYKMALEKVSTSISSGWWRTYAWENYDRAVAAYNPLYPTMFKCALENGLIRKYSGE